MLLLLLLNFLDHAFVSHNMLHITCWVEIQETESMEGVVVSPGTAHIHVVLHAALCHKYQAAFFTCSIIEGSHQIVCLSVRSENCFLGLRTSQVLFQIVAVLMVLQNHWEYLCLFISVSWPKLQQLTLEAVNYLWIPPGNRLWCWQQVCKCHVLWLPGRVSACILWKGDVVWWQKMPEGASGRALPKFLAASIF